MGPFNEKNVLIYAEKKGVHKPPGPDHLLSEPFPLTSIIFCEMHYVPISYDFSELKGQTIHSRNFFFTNRIE